MRKVNRSTKMSLFALMVCTLITLTGCASEKPAPPAAATPPPKPVSLAQIKTEILDAKTQLALTTESLNKLQKSSNADAQANYNGFSEQFIKLQAKSEAVSKRSEDLKKRASDYFAMWNRQVEVDNADLRRQAVQQKADAERIYNNINSEMELARLAFKPYVANLKDVGSYLKGNLTPANLSSISDLVQKANMQSKEVDTHVGNIVASIDKISTATGEGTGAASGATGGTGAPAAGAAGGTGAVPASETPR
jgi:hypothetical protein